MKFSLKLVFNHRGTQRRHRVAQRFSFRFSQTLWFSVAKNFVYSVVKKCLVMSFLFFKLQSKTGFYLYP